MHKVKLTLQAEQAYLKADSKLQSRMERVFEMLEQGRFQHKNIKALQGPLRGSLRYRLGDWRIVFRVDTLQKRFGLKR